MARPEFDFKVPSACGAFGVMNENGKRVSGQVAIDAIRVMHDRGNGLGGGFAGYGIYPELPDHYAFHLMYETDSARRETEDFLGRYFDMELAEPLHTREHPNIGQAPLLMRYFVLPKADLPPHLRRLPEDDFIVWAVMRINREIEDAYVASSGKNMGAFKGVGFPEDIGEFFRLEKYEGWLWTAHGRFPTNTKGWWGGAHPFALLDWSVVHNGEVSSYGINRRYLESEGYECRLLTDTEVVTYLLDLMVRRHGLTLELAAAALAPTFWKVIDRMPEKERELYRTIRIVYASALLNGPFAIIVGFKNGMMGLSDRVKLRPLVAGRKDATVYLSSEECAIREVCAHPDLIWHPKAGEPVISRLREPAEEAVA